MAIRLQSLEFWIIGLLIGGVLAVQLRSNAVTSSGEISQSVQLENKMLGTFTEEHRVLTAQLDQSQLKRSQLEVAYEKNTSPTQQKYLKNLRTSASLSQVSGPGLRIKIEDGYGIGGVFFTAPNLRDLINALFLQGAQAIVINGHRINALTPLHEAFDTLFVGNHQVASPFVIEAIGNPESLVVATDQLRHLRVKINKEKIDKLEFSANESLPNLIYTSLLDTAAVNPR